MELHRLEAEEKQRNKQQAKRASEDELDQRLRALALEDTDMQRNGATEEWLSVTAIELGTSREFVRASARRLKSRGLFPWDTDFYSSE
jgi:hypothetical protein